MKINLVARFAAFLSAYTRFSFFFVLTVMMASCVPDEDFEPILEAEPEPLILSEGAAVYQQMILDINTLRAAGCRCGNTNMPPVGALRWNDQVASAAAQHTVDMVQAGQLNHTGTDGSNTGDRLEQNGYQWRSYGENIASGYSSMSAVLQAWIDSPGHCRNLMNADFEEIGIAQKDRYWTQVFARPF